MAFNPTNVNNVKTYLLPQTVYDSMVQGGTVEEDSFYLTVGESGEEGTANALKVVQDTTTSEVCPVFFGQPSAEGKVSAIKYNTGVGIHPATGVLMGAAWNDYAEYRKFEGEKVDAGRVVCETGKDSVALSQERLQFAPAVISNTYGMVIGEQEDSVPIGVCGKVLVYPNENIEDYAVGDTFCSGPNGTASKMSRQEIINYPDRILGYFIGVPEKEIFNGILTRNKIWIRLK